MDVQKAILNNLKEIGKGFDSIQKEAKKQIDQLPEDQREDFNKWLIDINKAFVAQDTNELSKLYDGLKKKVKK